MAEGLFRQAVADRSDYEVSSAGVAASRGTPASRETLAILKKRGADLSGFTSRRVSKELLKKATHVFAMTRSHLQALEAMFPEFSDKFYLTCEFVDIPGEGIGADVFDPIGMGSRAYEEVAGVFGLAIPTIIAYIDSTTKEV